MIDSRKFILKKTAIIALGQALCVAVMIGVFALLGHFDRSVLLGGIFGGIIAIANFFAMAVCADLAADRQKRVIYRPVRLWSELPISEGLRWWPSYCLL